MGQPSCLPSFKLDQSDTANRAGVPPIEAFSSSSPRTKLVVKCKLKNHLALINIALASTLHLFSAGCHFLYSFFGGSWMEMESYVWVGMTPEAKCFSLSGRSHFCSKWMIAFNLSIFLNNSSSYKSADFKQFYTLDPISSRPFRKNPLRLLKARGTT